MLLALPDPLLTPAALAVAALGACLGSFLNVVIYRLPLRLSVVHPGSRCPVCKHAIRGYDNIPVLSWLVLLRGRCRDCGTPISARYPAVEAFVGLLSFVFAVARPVRICGCRFMPMCQAYR